MAKIVFALVKSLGKEEIAVPLGAVLATDRPQQQKRWNGHFERSTAVRAPHVQAPAKWATSKKIEPNMRHRIGHEPRMLTRPTFGVNPHGETVDDFDSRKYKPLPAQKPGGRYKGNAQHGMVLL